MPDKTAPNEEAARALYENLDESDHADWDELGNSAKEPWLRAWRAALSTTLEPGEAEIAIFAETAWNAWIHYRDVQEARWSELTSRQQGAWFLAMRSGLIAAARVRIGE